MTRTRLFNATRDLELQVFYDGWCPLCTSIVKLIKKFDWLDLIKPISLREPGIAQAYGLDPNRLLERIHARSPRTGSVTDGIDAVIRVASRVAPCWPLLPVLVVLRALGLGQWAYDQVAKRRWNCHRHRLRATPCARTGGASRAPTSITS